MLNVFPQRQLKDEWKFLLHGKNDNEEIEKIVNENDSTDANAMATHILDIKRFIRLYVSFDDVLCVFYYIPHIPIPRSHTDTFCFLT